MVNYDEEKNRMNDEPIHILYGSGDANDAERMSEYLSKFEGARFDVRWEKGAEKVFEYLEKGSPVDIIIAEDVLPDMSGVKFARKLRDSKSEIPLVFLTTSKDISFAVEVMRLGVKDCILKEDVTSRVLPQSLLRIVEKQRLKRGLSELEIKKKRLEAMQEIVVEISARIKEPLDEMRKVVDSLERGAYPEKAAVYLKLIKENVERMQQKLEKLWNLKEDKTVKYIRDIKMIDLS